MRLLCGPLASPSGRQQKAAVDVIEGKDQCLQEGGSLGATGPILPSPVWCEGKVGSTGCLCKNDQYFSLPRKQPLVATQLVTAWFFSTQALFWKVCAIPWLRYLAHVSCCACLSLHLHAVSCRILAPGLAGRALLPSLPWVTHPLFKVKRV